MRSMAGGVWYLRLVFVFDSVWGQFSRFRSDPHLKMILIYTRSISAITYQTTPSDPRPYPPPFSPPNIPHHSLLLQSPTPISIPFINPKFQMRILTLSVQEHTTIPPNLAEEFLFLYCNHYIILQ